MFRRKRGINLFASTTCAMDLSFPSYLTVKRWCHIHSRQRSKNWRKEWFHIGPTSPSSAIRIRVQTRG